MLEQLSRAGIDVTLRRSTRARRISISVRRSGAVTLTIPVGGDEATALRFLESNSEKIIAAIARQESMPKPKELSVEEQKEIIRAARVDLPARINFISTKTGLKFRKLSISKARTRWGSCSARNDISLSYHLMRLPEHLRDFIIIHELCHTVHHNHSPKFHALVNLHTNGREKELNRELRGHHI